MNAKKEQYNKGCVFHNSYKAIQKTTKNILYQYTHSLTPQKQLQHFTYKITSCNPCKHQ